MDNNNNLTRAHIKASQMIGETLRRIGYKCRASITPLNGSGWGILVVSTVPVEESVQKRLKEETAIPLSFRLGEVVVFNGQPV